MYLSPNEKPTNQTINEFVNRVNQKMTWSDDALVLDDHYRFNRKYYQDFAPIYSGYNAAVVLQTAIVLPFLLPFGDNVYNQPIWLTEKTGSFLTLLFSPVSDARKFLCGFLPDYGVTYDQFRSRCELVAMLRQDLVVIDSKELKPLELAYQVRNKKQGDQIADEQFVQATGSMFELMTKMVDSAISVVNSIIMSYAYQMQDDAVFPIELNSVEYASHFRIIEPKEWITFNWIHINNTHFPKDPFAPLDSQHIANVFSGAQHYHRDESVQHQWHLQRAMYEWQNGSSTNCIIYLVTSVEVLTREVLFLFLSNQASLPPDGVLERIENTPFKKILVSEMSSILGGKWNLHDESSPLYRWYNHVYLLRNRIVHGGYSPTSKEMLLSIQTSEEFRDFVHERISRNLDDKPYLRILSPATPEARLVDKKIPAEQGDIEGTS